MLRRGEETVPVVALAAMVLLPLAEAALRPFQTGVPGAATFVQHLTLWVGFLGAALAAREGKLLALATGELLPAGTVRRWSGIVAAAIGALASAMLCRAGVDLVLIERQAETHLALGIPTWVAQAVMPAAFGLIALRLVWKADSSALGRGIAGVGLAAGLLLGQFPGWLDGVSVAPGLAVAVIAALLGAPIFAVLGGVAVFLFLASGVPAAAVPVETYRLSVSPTLPAIPLFTLAGYLLAQGEAPRRMVDVFRTLVGWIPGGTAVVTALICAFFTVFTGGSGVTILALGGLLLAALNADGYRERFSLGLLTSSGSLGLLFPPALPLILYGIVAQVPIENLFIGGLLPGVLLVGLVVAWGLREGMRSRVPRQRFSAREAGVALWHGKWELAIPILVLVAIFSGAATLVEAAAMTALYAFVVQCLIHRDVSLSRDLVRVVTECVVLVGGVLIILGVAMGLTSYMVDAQIPMQILEWARQHIESPLVFLLALNLFLLVVGCLMDIFSAIVVVVPLIVPLGQAFGIDPIHLGIIFVANLELGYLTPPVGLNLFLASYRFEKPILEIWRSVLPPLAILAVGVLLITYVPWLTTGLVGWFGR